MKIVYLASGAGGMYCGSCLHGNTLVAALRSAGHDALLVPAYTPLRTDEENVSIDRMVFGGLNVYLQERSALFRFTPRFLDRLLDRPSLLRWIGRRSASTRPEQLGALTVSMLQGEEGRQRKELAKLLDWLCRDVRPDLVHLANVLLVGMARQIGRGLDVPVVCSLTGEDVFLEKVPQPYYSEARNLLRERCRDLAALVALNDYYADFMAEYLSVPRGRIHMVRPGLNLEGHAPKPGSFPDAPKAREPGRPVTIGYLARVCPDKGLHQLAEAFEVLATDDRLPPLRLRAAGYLGKEDQPYLDGIRSRLANQGLEDRFEYVGELDRAGKIAFLQSLDVMSVPTAHPESKGFPVLEAWANAVPVVLPAHGAFPEMIRDTGGGLLSEPHDPRSLAEGLKRLIQDPQLAADCARQAHQAVHEHCGADGMARRMARVYEGVVSGEW